MQLTKDNPYPQTLFHASLDPTQVLNEEQRAARINEGYQDTYIHRAFPKHIPTGNMRTVISPWDGGKTKVAETVIANDAAQERAILASLPDNEDDEQDDKDKEGTPPVARRRGRPARVPELVEA